MNNIFLLIFILKIISNSYYILTKYSYIKYLNKLTKANCNQTCTFTLHLIILFSLIILKVEVKIIKNSFKQ